MSSAAGLPPPYAEYLPQDHKYSAGTRFEEIPPTLLHLYRPCPPPAAGAYSDATYEHPYSHNLILPGSRLYVNAPARHKEKKRSLPSICTILIALSRFRLSPSEKQEEKGCEEEKVPLSCHQPIHRTQSSPDLKKTAPGTRPGKVTKSVSFSKGIEQKAGSSSDNAPRTTYTVGNFTFTQL